MIFSGCESFNFKLISANGRYGKCVIVAPSTAITPPVPDGDDPGWKFYTVNME